MKARLKNVLSLNEVDCVSMKVVILLGWKQSVGTGEAVIVFELEGTSTTYDERSRIKVRAGQTLLK